VKIGEVSGNAPYDKGYTCQPVGNGSDDYTLQVGPDVAIKITITYQKAPRETPLIDVNGMPTEVSGPYRNLPEPANVGPGREFTCTKQWDMILQTNRAAHDGVVHSDLAGFMYPCEINGKPTTCTEPLILKDPKDTPQNDPARAQVHHVVPKTDKRTCPWGTSSNKNAAVISRRLNQFLFNKAPPANEVTQINMLPAY